MTGTSLEQHQDGYRLPRAAPPHNEGKTVAGWAMVVVVTLGVLVSCVGLILERDVLTWVAGPVVMVVGLLLGLVLRLAGRGQKVERRQPTEWYEPSAEQAEDRSQ